MPPEKILQLVAVPKCLVCGRKAIKGAEICQTCAKKEAWKQQFIPEAQTVEETTKGT
jgi:hypothetical protein